MLLPATPLSFGDAALQPYLVDIQRSDWGDLLAPFSPPVPGSGTVVMASLFGDMFLELGGGEIWWVNAQMNQVTSIADSSAVFLAQLGADPATYLRTTLVDALVRQDMVLKPGMLYGLKQPPSEGGRWHPDNIGAAPIASAFAYWGDQFRRAQAVANATAPALIRGGGRPEKQTKKKGWFN